MKIAVLIPTLSTGGAERVASILCNEWVALGHEIHLLTYQHAGQPLEYALNPNVVHHALGLLRESHSLAMRAGTNLWRVARVRACLRAVAPDLVVCFMTEANVIGTLAARSLKLPVVISERNHPGYRAARTLDRVMRRIVYPIADRLTVQTADIGHWYERTLSLKPVTIPNPARLVETQSRRKNDRQRKQMIAVGRLVDQKGFDVLIEAFARIAPAHPDWDLTIYGEGPSRERLEAQIARHDLVGRLRLPGNVRDIETRLAEADLYVHASRFEGFPNAIVEALAAGLCVVATDSPGAAGELLGHGRYGLLARLDDPADLAAKIELALADEALRARFAERAREAVRHLDAPQIAGRWCQLFESLCAPARSRCR